MTTQLPNPVIDFRGEKLTLTAAEYATTRNLAWQLQDEIGMPYMTVTVNVEGMKIPHNMVLIKDWGENEGILDALVDQGIVDRPLTQIPCGFCEAHLCPIKVKVDV